MVLIAEHDHIYGYYAIFMVLAFVHHFPVCRYVLVVLFEAVGETMMTVPIADEV